LKKRLLVALLLWLVSLLAGVAALLLAEFGAPAWTFVLLLGWLVTFGLPTLSALLLVIRFWDSPSALAFLLLSAALTFACQFAVVSLFWWGTKRVMSRRET
jgi:hypothetical protein